MKRILYLLLMIPLLGFIVSSCDDDKDLPQVSLALDYEGGTEQDGTIYVVQGDTLEITGLRAIPAEGTKAATVTNVRYSFDGVPIGAYPVSPFEFGIPTADLKLGKHSIGVVATVLQVDKEIGFAVTQFPVEIVADDTQQPGEGDSGTITPETRITDDEK